MGYFKSEEANNLFDIWMNGFPESYHSCDMARWSELVLSVLESGEIIERRMIEESFSERLDQNDIDNYMIKYESMSLIYNLMIENGYRNAIK